jgi:hypothetical protein
MWVIRLYIRLIFALNIVMFNIPDTHFHDVMFVARAVSSLFHHLIELHLVQQLFQLDGLDEIRVA